MGRAATDRANKGMPVMRCYVSTAGALLAVVQDLVCAAGRMLSWMLCCTLYASFAVTMEKAA